ncbi:MAG: serine/threonine-protein kinase [Myxococcota bacterium]
MSAGLTQDDSSLAELASLPDPKVGPGAQIGRYYVLKRIGAGGMGVVFAAFDPDLDRKVALKLLHPERLEGDLGSRGHARLIREAKAMAQLSHPHVVTVHDVGVFDERVFVAMEFVEGQTLSEWFEAGHGWEEVVRCMTLAGEGLAAAHRQGLVHRDFKPDNVLVGDDGRPRVLDFGLARAAGALPTEPEELPDTALDSNSLEDRFVSREGLGNRLTRTGGLTGTPAYMAPEQYLGKEIDARTDQFAFCVALWEGLYGRRPFSGGSTAALGMAVCAGQLEPPPEDANVPPFLRRILERGLSVEPEDRFDSMRSLLGALNQSRGAKNRHLWMGAGAVGVPLAALAVFAVPEQDPCTAGQTRIADTWSDARAASLRDAFNGVDVRYAADAADAAVRLLDAHADAWVAAHRDACEATHVRKEQSPRALDVRMGCLGRQLEATGLLVDALESPDERIIRNAAQVVGKLPAADACADAEAIEARLQAPEDPAVAEAVADVRRQIVALRQRVELGADVQHVAEAASILEQAQQTGHLPLVAEARYGAARAAVRSGDANAGLEHLRETVYAALASDHDLLLAQAFTQLAHTEGVLFSRYEAGMEWSRHAEAAVSRIDHDGIESSNLEGVMCKFLADKGQTVDALPHCIRGIDLAERVFGEDSLAVAHAHEALGIAYFYGHRHEEALTEFEIARDGMARNIGASHPNLARIANSLAAVCHGLKGAGPCIGMFEDAVERATAAMGPDHLMVLNFRNNYAQMLVEVGRVEEARAHASQSLKAWREKHGDDHPAVAASLRIIGQAHRLDGKLDQARSTLESALTIATKTRGRVHRDVLSIEEELVEVAIQQRDAGEARRHFDSVAAMSEALGEGQSTEEDEDLDALRAAVEALEATPPQEP